jgi:hypothetical protein
MALLLGDQHCKCCMCNEIRETVENIDPEFTRTSKHGAGMNQGMNHATLLNTYNNDYQKFLQAKKMEMKQVLEITELEVKQLELDVKKTQLQCEKAQAIASLRDVERANPSMDDSS